MGYYRIIVENHIDKKRLRVFNGLQDENLPNGRTLLHGKLKDQAELFSVINKIRDMNLQLVLITNDDGIETTEFSEKSDSTEILKVLDLFQEGYTKGDVNQIDNFMKELFDKDESITIIGTSNGEWFLNYDEAKEIFLSDWQYWGSLKLKANEAQIKINNNTARVFVPALVSQSFKESEDRYGRYLGGVKSYFEEGNSNYEKPLKNKLTEINWTLSHLLHQRNTNERKYWLDLRVSFILTRKSEKWIVRQIQFSYPTETLYPDERIFENSGVAETHEEDLRKIKSYSSLDKYGNHREIKELINRFKDEFQNPNKSTGSMISELFCGDALFVNTDKNISKNLEEISRQINIHRERLEEFELNCENAIINSEENSGWVVASGIIKAFINEEETCKSTAARIQHIFESNAAHKEKLFRIRREIAATLKETAVGEEFSWPFRFEAFLVKENGKWMFEYMQLSYPFYWILEGKTNAEAIEII